ncbi:hypothetical protein [Ancylobacter sp. TS-1]|uniref:hypothetical protein n=1 Tax=Ancylobacter sp. TS-1 TaxID=1850374 RepID=UPI001265CFB2|nr:hypothetical protein [Ancylobacter sp. TS-1]QFR34700.1 hypothetical protein GBB76_17210 [Ancylobacter sp. TS-1]
MDNMEFRAVCLGAATKTASGPEEMIRHAFAYEVYLFGGADAAFNHLNERAAAIIAAAAATLQPGAAEPDDAGADSEPDRVH